MKKGDKLYIKRDGKVLAQVYGVMEAMAWLHRHQPQSFDWALQYEGYTVERADGSRALEPYSR